MSDREATDHSKFVPTSPTFSKNTVLVTLLPETTPPNCRESLESRSSTPRQPPDTEKSVFLKPLHSNTTSWVNGLMRFRGLKVRLTTVDSRPRK